MIGRARQRSESRMVAKRPLRLLPRLDQRICLHLPSSCALDASSTSTSRGLQRGSVPDSRHGIEDFELEAMKRKAIVFASAGQVGRLLSAQLRRRGSEVLGYVSSIPKCGGSEFTPVAIDITSHVKVSDFVRTFAPRRDIFSCRLSLIRRRASR
jgi:hypothetical protein